MQNDRSSSPHLATMDVSLGGVFIGRGERIPDDLYEAWRRRLEALGLDLNVAFVPLESVS